MESHNMKCSLKLIEMDWRLQKCVKSNGKLHNFMSDGVRSNKNSCQQKATTEMDWGDHKNA
jgi:hypothetical protein